MLVLPWARLESIQGVARGLELGAPARSLGAWHFLEISLMTASLQLKLPGPSPKGLGLEFDSQAQG